MDQPTLGFIGLGHMGGALARRLLQSGPLTVYDRRPEAADALAGAGATVASSAAALAAESEFLFLCLPESTDVKALLFGTGGVAEMLQPESVVVDMTTGDPAASRAIAERLEQMEAKFADAPVSGGPMGAERGTLGIMVGAEPAVFERVRPLLQRISPNVAHMGGVGAGHTMKLANNMLNAVCRLATAEAVALAAKNGVDPAVAVAALQAGSGRNYATEITFPRDILSGALRQGFTMGLMHKDVRTAAALARETGVAIPFGELAEAVYRAGEAHFGGDADVNRTVETVETESGVRIRGNGTGRP